jgi:hypothetical protein
MIAATSDWGPGFVALGVYLLVIFLGGGFLAWLHDREDDQP